MKMIKKGLQSNTSINLFLVSVVSIWQIFGVGKVNLRLSQGIDHRHRTAGKAPDRDAQSSQ